MPFFGKFLVIQETCKISGLIELYPRDLLMWILRELSRLFSALGVLELEKLGCQVSNSQQNHLLRASCGISICLANDLQGSKPYGMVLSAYMTA